MFIHLPIEITLKNYEFIHIQIHCHHQSNEYLNVVCLFISFRLSISISFVVVGRFTFIRAVQFPNPFDYNYSKR